MSEEKEQLPGDPRFHARSLVATPMQEYSGRQYTPSLTVPVDFEGFISVWATIPDEAWGIPDITGPIWIETREPSQDVWSEPGFCPGQGTFTSERSKPSLLADAGLREPYCLVGGATLFRGYEVRGGFHTSAPFTYSLNLGFTPDAQDAMRSEEVRS